MQALSPLLGKRRAQMFSGDVRRRIGEGVHGYTEEGFSGINVRPLLLRCGPIRTHRSSSFVSPPK